MLAYDLAKTSLATISNVLAIELGPQGIRVNTLRYVLCCGKTFELKFHTFLVQEWYCRLKYRTNCTIKQ